MNAQCPECHGSGRESDEKGFKTGYVCATCGGDGEVTQEVRDAYYQFFSAQWDDEPIYVNESWRIRREENRMTPAESDLMRNARLNAHNAGGGKCGLIVGFVFLMPFLATIPFFT